MEEERYKNPRVRIFGEGMERINAFSDGIFAIAITLLVLEIHVPELTKGELDQLPDKLWALEPQILTFGLSFLVIGVYWMLHHGIFSYIRRYDSGLLWLNNFFLLTVAFQPFPTAVLGAYGSTTAAVVFYSGTQVLSGLFKLLIWVYASYKHRLIDADLEGRFIRYYTLQSFSTVFIFALSIVLAFINNDIAKFSWLLLAVDGPLIRLIYPPEPRKDKSKDLDGEVTTNFGPVPNKSITAAKSEPPTGGQVSPAKESGQSKTDKE